MLNDSKFVYPNDSGHTKMTNYYKNIALNTKLYSMFTHNFCQAFLSTFVDLVQGPLEY